ncbi:hypothetical protein L204_100634 [Cryptococcus depauperatus]
MIQLATVETEAIFPSTAVLLGSGMSDFGNGRQSNVCQVQTFPFGGSNNGDQSEGLSTKVLAGWGKTPAKLIHEGIFVPLGTSLKSLKINYIAGHYLIDDFQTAESKKVAEDGGRVDKNAQDENTPYLPPLFLLPFAAGPDNSLIKPELLAYQLSLSKIMT